jgi:hypothetical protein
LDSPAKFDKSISSFSAFRILPSQSSKNSNSKGKPKAIRAPASGFYGGGEAGELIWKMEKILEFR